MTAVFPARRAEEFNDLVEGTSTREVRDPRVADLLELVTGLRAVEPVTPRPEFSATLREELMAAADTLLLPSADTQRLTLPPRRTARDRRIAALVGGLAVVGATSSLAVAAQSALPGEMLYPLKRVIENAETGIQTSDEDRGVSLLGNATDRLDEVTALSRTADLGESDAIAHTLTTFSDQALEASDLLLADYAQTGDQRPVQQLRDFTGLSMQTLGQLEAILPEEARDELQYAAQVLGQIDAAAEQACPQCPGGITEIPAALAAGTVPEPDLVLVPGPVLSGGQSASTSTGGGQGPKDDTGRQGDVGGSKDVPAGETGGDGTTLPDNPVSPPADADTGQSTGPVGDLLGGLTGQGGEDASNGTDPLDPVEDVVEDVDEILPDLGG